MPVWIKLLLFYLLAVNLITFFAFGVDKQKARRETRRIRESTLLTLAAAGGSAGGILGMRIFRHKTLHRKFSVGMPTILILELGAAVLACRLL